MSQQINLYKVEKKKQEFEIRFEYLLSIFWIYILGLALVTTYDSYKYFNTKKEEEALSKLQEDRSQKLQNISKKVPQENTRQQIIVQIEKYESQIKQKQTILSMLSSSEKKKIEGYSSYLEWLARMPVQGLWLTEFVFKNNGEYLLLQGKALEPHLIPTLISSLSKSPDFSGKTFEIFKMSLNEETKQVDFILETKTQAEP